MPSVLEYCGDNVKSNKKIVRRAVKIDGRTLLYAAPNLRNDPKLVLLAV